MKVMLLFPPHWCSLQPYISLPCLTAYLRAHGVNVVQKDVNAEAFDWLLSRESLNRVLDVLRARFDQLHNSPDLSDEEYSEYLALVPFVLREMECCRKVEVAKAVLRSKDLFYQLDKFDWAWNVINQAFQLTSLAYFPTCITSSTLDIRGSSFSSADVLNFALNPKENPFFPFFEKNTVPDIEEQQPDILGISITSVFQLGPAFSLAHLVKSAGIECHITLGGGFLTRLADVLEGAERLFEFVDSIIVGEGEIPLLELVKSLAKQGSLQDVPNLIFKSGGKIERNPLATPPELSTLPVPTFDGMPFHKYLSPEKVLPVLAGRGCPWHKCAFCDEFRSYQMPYRERNPVQVASEIEHLAKKYRTCYFQFSSESISPVLCKELARAIRKTRVPIKWSARARLDLDFGKDMLLLAKKAGCEMLCFGLESANQRVLNLMEKGITPAQALKVLEASKEADIWTHVFILFGFPSETIEEARETVQFVLENRHTIDSVDWSFFVLKRHAPVYKRKESLGIEIIDNLCEDLNTQYNFLLSYNYRGARTAITRDQYQALIEELKTHFADWYRLTNREHHFLHLCQWKTKIQC